MSQPEYATVLEGAAERAGQKDNKYLNKYSKTTANAREVDVSALAALRDFIIFADVEMDAIEPSVHKFDMDLRTTRNTIVEYFMNEGTRAALFAWLQQQVGDQTAYFRLALPTKVSLKQNEEPKVPCLVFDFSRGSYRADYLQPGERATLLSPKLSSIPLTAHA